MTAAVIEIEGLRKEYRRLRRGRTVAVDGLDLSVPQGGVFGFLGPNGSGKTTTIRCLLGLVSPSSARSLRVLGTTVPHGLAGVISKIGSIVEAPTFFPGFSGRRNLRLLARVDGIGRQPVEDVLTRVGLSERARDPVRSYSLGMKQRLGVAAALLKDPALLVLDEPANGLDPAGIREMRELMRTLGAEGRTVFLSSHILTEVEQTCDQVAILARGRCVVAGPVRDVLSSGHSAALVVRVVDIAAGARVLGDAGIPVEARGDWLRVALPATDAARVSETLGRAGLWVTELRPEEISLEDVFLELTGRDVR
jgi:ABC-2 type transport system ATP-binding protein